MGLAGAASSSDLKDAATSVDAATLDHARFDFDRRYKQRSAKRVFFITQILAFIFILAGFVWSALHWPNTTFFALHVAALVLFATAIAWRLVAASILTPPISRLAEPRVWPIYTILCPVYREAAVVSDLVAALERLDYPGLMHQRGV
jgi:glycosyltransferase XagB